MAPLKGAMGRIDSLQALRAIAAATVMYWHIGSPLQRGLFGVDMFFVLSGFVISMVLVQTRPTALTFAIDRITRIVPLYWLMTTLLFVAASIDPSPFKPSIHEMGHYLRSLLFILYLKENGVRQPILSVGWTLTYEMIFYAVALVVFYLARIRSPAANALAITFMCIFGTLAPGDSAVLQILTSPLLLEFCFGIGVWYVYSAGVRCSALISIVGIAVGLGLMIYLDVPVVKTQLEVVVKFGIPSTFVLFFTLNLESHLRAGLLKRMLIHLGDASYAVYLTHLFVVEFFRKLLPHLNSAWSITTLYGVLFTMSVGLLVGSLVYVYVDAPLVALARRLVRQRCAIPTSHA